MRYYLVAGEASGDLHASNLMKAILQKDSKAEFRYFGGDKMQSVGGTLVKHYKNLAYMGVWPVLTHLRTILTGAKICFNDISAWNPDVVILVDYPGFNLSIAKQVKHKLHIPVYYYISPKLWAWKSYRIKNIKRDVDKLFSILPFEVEYFAQKDYQIDYVGNPCVDAVAEFKNMANKPEQVNGGEKKILALLAGSRKQEISRNLPIMLQSIRGIENVRPVLAAAPGISPEFYSGFLANTDVEILYGKTYSILDGAYAAMVTSGTATLETALFNVPQIVCYKMPLGWIVSKLRPLFIKVKFISLVNLIAGKEVVPELVANEMNVKSVRQHLLPLLSETAERKAQLDGYVQMSEILGGAGASIKAAAHIVDALNSANQLRK